jgi:hypothetical protein
MRFLLPLLTEPAETALATAAEAVASPGASPSPAAEPDRPWAFFDFRLPVVDFRLAGGRGPTEIADRQSPIAISEGGVLSEEISDTVAPTVSAPVVTSDTVTTDAGPDVPAAGPHESEPPAEGGRRKAEGGSQKSEGARGEGRRAKEEALRIGRRNAAMAASVIELRASGATLDMIAAALGLSRNKVWRLLRRAARVRRLDAESMAPGTTGNGRKPTVAALTRGELEAVRAILLQTNRTRDTGSTTEALLIAIERGLIRAEMVALIRARLPAGQSPLTERQMHWLHIPAPVVRAYRAPRGAWLENVSSSGALQVDIDPATGEEAPIPAGVRWTLDDGSINLLVIIPGLEIPGDKCFDKWGVCVGRFQLLLMVDQGSQAIIGFNYTCRPREAYRAEDLVATVEKCVELQGAPRDIVLERGISAARLVTETVGAAGIRILRAHSPHQKIVELVFGKLWTALSPLPGQVGRSRGEYEAMARLQRSIQDGATDPRGLLLTLADFLAALEVAIARVNARWVDGRKGLWVPADAWGRQTGTRPVPGDDLWMFMPVVTEPLLVRGTQVTVSLPLVPGRSELFVFSDVRLLDWSGSRVKLFFNPFAPEVRATVVLAHDSHGKPAGTILGTFEHTDRLTRFTRRKLGYGEDKDIGRETTAESSRALVNAVKAIGAPAPVPKRIANRPLPIADSQDAKSAKGEAAVQPRMDTDGHGCRDIRNPPPELRTPNSELRTPPPSPAPRVKRAWLEAAEAAFLS